jgi:DNA-binding MarR family transcriptional regulator
LPREKSYGRRRKIIRLDRSSQELTAKAKAVRKPLRRIRLDVAGDERLTALQAVLKAVKTEGLAIAR